MPPTDSAAEPQPLPAGPRPSAPRARAWASFQQLLLFGFLILTAALVAVALRAVYQYDDLIKQSRDTARSALQLSGAAQALAERSAAMERSGRQSLVLNDSVLRRRFDEASRDAQSTVEQLLHNGLLPQSAQLWRDQLASIEALLKGPSDTALAREGAMAAQFRDLDALNTQIAQQAQFLIQAQNTALSDRLDHARTRLVQQVVAASIVAVLMALGFGLWLARPFKRLERAIHGLGENRLDEPIDIHGPADVRRISRELDWLRLRLMELDADKARFLRHVSHELKTPLAALREGVSLLEEGVTGELNPAQKEVAQILQQNTLTLQGQIEALLRFNAAAFEARQLHRVRTPLLPLIQTQIEAQRLQWQAQELSVQAHGEPVTVLVDAVKLGTVIGNLLSNAIRFSARGGTIQFTVQAQADTVSIDLRDAGPGVAPEDRTRVFEPFYRGERQPEHAVKGTGIGLSIVQEYIAAHGGRIELLPQDPERPGAHFRIELPRTA